MAAARRRGAQALSFSSSTASSISEHAWARASAARARLEAGESCADIAEEQRAVLARRIGVHAMGGEIVFAPSGTDAALLALAIARATMEGGLVSVLAAADETGSGAPHAVAGRHFACADGARPRGRARRAHRGLRRDSSL